MAHYDKDTKKFMDDVAGDDEMSLRSQLVRSTANVAKRVARGKPLTEAIGRQLVAIPTFAALEKQGGLKILDIYKLLNTHYNESWWDWEPETIWQTLSMDHDIEATEAVKNIIQALQMVVKTDAAFEHWHVFEKVAQAFSENPVNFGQMQPLELDEAALAVKILEHIRPKAVYQDEVCAYIAVCAKNSGIVYLPSDYFPGCSQEKLDDMHNNMELKAEVMSGKKTDDPESALGIQRQRLKHIQDYVKERL